MVAAQITSAKSGRFALPRRCARSHHRESPAGLVLLSPPI